MNCNRCGAALPDNATFCTNCANPNPFGPPSQGAAPPPQGAYAAQGGGYPPQGGYAPQGGGYGPPPQIADYLIWSIVTTLCCCLPLGIAGIVFSIQCKNDLKIGNYASAEKNSKNAFYCNLIGLIGGLIINAAAFGISFMAEMQNQGAF